MAHVLIYIYVNICIICIYVLLSEVQEVLIIILNSFKKGKSEQKLIFDTLINYS
jgi:hypothetical protein